MILVNGSPNNKKAVLISQGRQGLPGAGVPSGTSDGDVLQFFSGGWVGQPLNARTVVFNGTQAATLGTDVSTALDYLATQGAAYLPAIGNNANDIASLTAADSLVDNGDGTYGHTDNAGNVVTIDTNGATAAYVFGGTGTYTIGAANVDAAIQLLDTALSAINPTSLVDNGDGTYTYTNTAGAPVNFNAGWTQVTQNPTTGVITVAYPDGTTVDVQGLPSTPASSATPVPGQITVADGTNAAYPVGVLLFG